MKQQGQRPKRKDSSSDDITPHESGLGTPMFDENDALPKSEGEKYEDYDLLEDVGDAGAEPVKKRPAGAGIGDASAGPMKKRPATGAAMKRPSGADCTAIVPVEDPDALGKDRNKWAKVV